MSSIESVIKDSVWSTVSRNISGVMLTVAATDKAKISKELEAELNKDDELISGAVSEARSVYGSHHNRGYLESIAYKIYYGFVDDIIKIVASLREWSTYQDGKVVLDRKECLGLEMVNSDQGPLKRGQRYFESPFGSCTETVSMGEGIVEFVYETSKWPDSLKVTAKLNR